MKTSDETMNLPTRLRWAREQAGLSQGQVAKLLGVHRPTISQLESGARNLRAQELKQLADIYDVELEWLTTGISRLASDPRIQIAARQLAKLSKKDLGVVLDLLKVMREHTDEHD